MDATTRESHLRMIRSLRRAYRAYALDLIVNRATMGRGTVDDLSDGEIVALHHDLYRAIDCVRNDVPFEVAGLIDEGDSCAWVV
jgi:hypothetical protein